jgi:hypothetical protein
MAICSADWNKRPKESGLTREVRVGPFPIVTQNTWELIKKHPPHSWVIVVHSFVGVAEEEELAAGVRRACLDLHRSRRRETSFWT